MKINFTFILREKVNKTNVLTNFYAARISNPEGT